MEALQNILTSIIDAQNLRHCLIAEILSVNIKEERVILTLSH